ncbi:hypothetical protein ACLMJK_009495 [Lecanora helva]
MADDDYLRPGSDTYTYERVQDQLRRDTLVRNAENEGYTPAPIDCYSFTYVLENRQHRFFSKEKQHTLREEFCRRLYERLDDAGAHCAGLDTLFSELFTCNLVYDDPSHVVSKACGLLQRLPSVPVKLPDLPADIDTALPNACEFALSHITSGSIQWSHLQVVSRVTANVMRLAIIVAIYGVTASSNNFRLLINTIADLLSTASLLSSSAERDDDRCRWFLVRAFLWTSWQRGSMLYFYSIVGSNARSGFYDHNGDTYVLKSPLPAPGVSIQEMSTKFAGVCKSDYLCGWAFELLRSHRCAIGLDFRRFHRRFSATFGDHNGRCIARHEESCEGDGPASCQRFRGMKIENQSMHDDECRKDCARMVWNEASYRSVEGGRAVRLADGHSQLTYCEASNQTLAISHVWSHGQGGRPEEGHGMNACLHRRYTSIAKSLGCDSYWMDTPCIPEDHRLRREAIMKINEIFEQSKATLICDRDLMDIDASDLDITVRETIIVTAIVCDWNLRAWTFLEAFRGRDHTHVLCKGNIVVSLRDTVKAIYDYGSIDIALFLLTVPHLLPSRTRKGVRSRKDGPSKPGFVTLETAASHLSHREASRSGDDVVIWSLLLDDTVSTSAIEFWTNRVGKTISTAYLISSAPRVDIRGWKWAPSSPTAQSLEVKSKDARFRLMADGNVGADLGNITQDGLSAQWLMYDFVGGRLGSRALSIFTRYDMEPHFPQGQNNLRRIRQKFLAKHIWGAILQPRKFGSLEPGDNLDEPVVHRSDSIRQFVAVCGTNERYYWFWKKQHRIPWTWCGVYEWDMREPLPQFVRIDDILIT